MTQPPKAGVPRLWQIVEEFPTHPLELLGGVSAFSRGVYLLVFAEKVHTGDVAQFVESMWRIEIWGWILIVFGVIQLWGLVLERNWPEESLLLRFVASLVLVALSALMLVGYLRYEHDSIAVPLYLTMTLKQLWIFVRSRGALFLHNGRGIVRRRLDPLAGGHGPV